MTNSHSPYTPPEAPVGSDAQPFRWWAHVLLLVVLPPVVGLIVTVALLIAGFDEVATQPAEQKSRVLTESISFAMNGVLAGGVLGLVGLVVTVFRGMRHGKRHRQ